MKKLLTLLLAQTICATGIVKAQNFEWAKSISGSDGKYVTDMTVDGNGNVITTGYFYNTADFDPGPGLLELTSDFSSADIFIQKLDANGNLIWAKRIGASYDDEAMAVKTDANGNIYLAGAYEQTVDFDPGSAVHTLNAYQSKPAFLLKLDANGNYVWVKDKAIPLNNGLEVDDLDLTIDNNGNTYMAYAFGDPHIGNQDIYIEKSDNTGTTVWKKGISVPALGGYEMSNPTITLDANNNVLISGNFRGSADMLGETLFSLGEAIFILKTDNAGNLIFAKNLSVTSSSYVQAFSMVTDATSNIYLAGTFYGELDFNPGPAVYTMKTNTGQPRNMYILQLDAAGQFGWARAISSDGIVYDLAFNASSIYAVGTFRGAANFFQTSNITSVDYDAFTLKMSGTGTTDWVQVLGGNEEDYGQALAVASNGSVYTSGEFNSTANFNYTGSYTMTAASAFGDVFIQKVKTCPATTITATVTKNVLAASEPNAIYQWIDCKDNSDIAGATAQIYTATKNGQYAVKATVGGCSYISQCYTISGLGVESNNNTIPNIYPNPTNGDIAINLGKNYEHVKVVITSVVGAIVYSGEYNNSDDLHIPITGVSGVYFVTITADNNASYTTRVMKN